MSASYLDIVVRPDPETPTPILLSKLFEHLHVERSRLGISSVGISFPRARANAVLGDTLRLHGDGDVLRSLKEAPWFRRAADYYRIGEPASVPSGCPRRVVRRIQPKMTPAKIRRGLKRGSITEEAGEEMKQRDGQGLNRVDALFLQVRSRSNGQRFRMLFEQVPADDACSTEFDSYGFGGAVPWF